MLPSNGGARYDGSSRVNDFYKFSFKAVPSGFVTVFFWMRPGDFWTWGTSKWQFLMGKMLKKTIKIRGTVGTVLPYLQTSPSLVSCTSCTSSLGTKRIEEQNFVRHWAREMWHKWRGQEAWYGWSGWENKLPTNATDNKTHCLFLPWGFPSLSFAASMPYMEAFWQVLSE